MSWFWLNIPLGAVFFLATAGIPLYMVLKYPDDRRAEPARLRAKARATDATPQSRPVFAVQHYSPALSPVG
jgi:hypothetical protein